jgi:S-adenosylmethionine synthetase
LSSNWLSGDVVRGLHRDRRGAANLKRSSHGKARSLANDTSIGVGFAPYTALEAAVSLLPDAGIADVSKSFPCAGLDFKVILRNREVTLTIALAIIDRHIASVRSTSSARTRCVTILLPVRPAPSCGSIRSTTPAPRTRGVYLTVSGTSAEMGDDGQVDAAMRGAV